MSPSCVTLPRCLYLSFSVIVERETFVLVGHEDFKFRDKFLIAVFLEHRLGLARLELNDANSHYQVGEDCWISFIG